MATDENFLKLLPADIQAKFREAEAEDEFKALTKAWEEINQSALDGLLTVATIAWASAATPEEREMVTQHTAMVLTLVRQTKIVTELMVPPIPRKQMLDTITRGIGREIAPRDAWLRENFAEAAKAREEILGRLGANAAEPKS